MDFTEFSAKTVDEAITEATAKMGITSDQLEIEVVDEGSKGFLGFNSKPAVIRVRRKLTIEDEIKEFLASVFGAMGLEVVIEIKENEEEKVYDVELKGDEMNVLIGKRGQTLDSLQYLTNLVINKKSEEYVKVKLDTQDYRQRRQDTLENLAKNIAYKVKRSRKPVSLEPMNPFERRIIHSALQNDKYVTTYSEGEEPYRHVVVALSDVEMPQKKSYGNRNGRYSRGGNNNRRNNNNRRRDFNKSNSSNNNE